MKYSFAILTAILLSMVSRAQLPLETFNKQYKGSIGPYNISAYIIGRFGSLSGHYSYDSQKGADNTISLFGKKNGKNIVLQDEDPTGTIHETFAGRFINDSTIHGEWKMKARKYPFTLHEIKSGQYPKTIGGGKYKVFVGLDPWESKFFEQLTTVKKLKQILGTEYVEYLQFLTGSGFMPTFELEDGLLIEDFSYLHIGCMNQSILVIDLNTNQFYLCWIKDNADDIGLYYDKSNKIPAKVLSYFANALNTGWGYTYNFSIAGNRVVAQRR